MIIMTHVLDLKQMNDQLVMKPIKGIPIIKSYTKSSMPRNFIIYDQDCPYCEVLRNKVIPKLKNKLLMFNGDIHRKETFIEIDISSEEYSEYYNMNPEGYVPFIYINGVGCVGIPIDLTFYADYLFKLIILKYKEEDED